MAHQVITPRNILRRNALLARFAQAEAQADASNARVRQRSAERLEAILKTRDLKTWIAGVRDPALTPLDRSQLEQAIAAMEPKERRLFSLHVRDRLEAVLRHTIYHRRAVVHIAFFVGLISVEVWASYVHTPVARPVRLAHAFVISWTLPDGSIRQQQEDKDARVILMRRPNGQLVLQRWFDRVGYGDLAVKRDFVRQETYLSD